MFSTALRDTAIHCPQAVPQRKFQVYVRVKPETGYNGLRQGDQKLKVILKYRFCGMLGIEENLSLIKKIEMKNTTKWINILYEEQKVQKINLRNQR